MKSQKLEQWTPCVIFTKTIVRLWVTHQYVPHVGAKEIEQKEEQGLPQFI